jgi:hypothetical protein
MKNMPIIQFVLKDMSLGLVRWLVPVIPATREAEVLRIVV